ncbi:Gfo/Idh/MocA family protein [Paenibacillus sp. 1001270B_150601_E10]|uniref:Gfo/Idh/MocA family protein n=1 Tax=Paenibacillus sp. 1001270B_150601_E10 TaxID=2787079 RepID=UPI00189EE6D9|nr:Gfo/Idh/MocA family oxidoreductase [Paenibacillus sp. 1001270B_150601_E10]
MLKAGIIGAGNISGIYLQNGRRFESMEITAIADLDRSRAEAKGLQYGIRALSVEDMLMDAEIDLIINLTIPKAHAAVNLQALEAGKHVYVEKPFAVSLEEGKEVLRVAEARGLYVGGAPDTFLGGGIQTCVKLILEGAIGTPVGATAFMMSGGHESWHPDPAFYYMKGGGPLFDMGPYYITVLIAMLGPIHRVTGAARISAPERTITSEPKAGEKIRVEVPTHVAGIMEFKAGPIATLLTSFDIPGGSVLPRMEVYGTGGSLLVPDPNDFGGKVMLRKSGESEWKEIELTHGYAENARGLGAAEMAAAIARGTAHRASGRLAYHVLETMHGFHASAEQGVHIVMHSDCDQPAALPAGLHPTFLHI